ncbi:DnaT-like ssDNA-binding protein [Sneathiella chinensis]|uniref:Putative DnaT-like domain-containing protein n=1 Tax=Sneathiella chinensis TaxID=349750 RepID=A0ABQ5U5T2_9PROT|nr:DnaT-like ssDNA-binding protein [Sneathiella chinensis]GLQ07515.1 hypothetical protein GCM10007924_27360 [Sneathiella chinensis]
MILETGSGIEGADSYVGLADASSHFAALGHHSWNAAADPVREQALIRASLYVDSFEYPGRPRSDRQGLKWPRTGARDADGRLLAELPHALRTAVLELAARFVTGGTDLMGGREVSRQKIGPVEIVYSGAGRQPSFVFRLLQQIGARPARRELRRG